MVMEQIDRLLSMLVEEASRAENTGQPFPLTIVFVERKVGELCLMMCTTIRSTYLSAVTSC